MAELDAAARLRHYDRSQLLLQVSEIIGDRAYLRHGIEVNEGDVVLDVGANVGVAAVFFAELCGAKSVHSFEPVRPLFELLEENVRHLAACCAHPYGLSAQAGTAEITYYPDVAVMSGLYAEPERDLSQLRRAMTNMGLSEEEARRRVAGYRSETMACELRTLSGVIAELGIDTVDLLKIDVERAELDVLKGIAASDWPSIRQLVAEIHEDAHARAVADLLAHHGFDITWDRDHALSGTPARLVFARRA